ncbi:WXG100 family type VII secretion target [Kitasatospora sp. NPDC094011]|uniref:WXG100 family type VII secretion target n=1 Tax=Kitasatospora sp. NPDC094011 TaxID=3364090 RepID=UPI0038035FFC
MSDGQFTVTAQEMMDFAGKIETAIGQIETERNALQTTVDNITSGWKGQAADSYKALQSKVNDDVKALKDSLTAIKHAIELTTKHYASAEEEQKALFGPQS